jgi:indole-3-glycerol phosphate synthase
MDTLDRLVENAESLVAAGYYNTSGSDARAPSFLESLGTPNQPSDVIAEIKFSSPTRRSGKSPKDFDHLLKSFAAMGPLGFSILAEPRVFGGGLDLVRHAARMGLPVLMKDIVVSPSQIEAASDGGASTILLIEALEARGHLRMPIQSLIDRAHDRGLDVVLETHTLEEWDAAIGTDADILGINNRDLGTMAVDLGTTNRILSSRRKDRPVISMSGVEGRAQVAAMRRAGADAVLVGTSIMSSPDPARTLGELLHG